MAEKKVKKSNTSTDKKVTKTKASKTTVKVTKRSVQDYKDIINWKKWEAHNMDWLYIDINADDLLTEVEAGVSNLKTVCDAIYDCMLEGDFFIVEPTSKTRSSKKLAVRYYCDNLSESRRKYSEVNN